jgi:hypothetical protein
MKVIKEDRIIILYRCDLRTWVRMVQVSELTCYDFTLAMIDIDSANRIVFIDDNGNMRVLKDRYSHF